MSLSACSFKPGDRVKIANACPIDCEGVGPIPGDVGQVVSMPEPNDALHCLRVYFERIQASWAIPLHYLELA